MTYTKNNKHFLQHKKNLLRLHYQKPKNETTMLTAELDTPKLRRQVIDRVQRLDSQSLTKLLFIIDNHQYENFLDEDDDDVEIDLDFPTPQTPEEARKEIEEIEEEIRQGKCMTLDEFIAHTNQKLNSYESYFV